jgi:hypothetical protein
MKRLTTLLTMVLAAIVTLTFTSCEQDDDFAISSNLEGIWQGSLGQYYDSFYGSDYGYLETEFRFANYSDNSTSGEGVQIDYDPDAWSQYKEYPFRWNVAYGNIYLHYEDGTEMVLRDYSMSGSRLRGTLELQSGEFAMDLDLVHTDYWPWGSSYAKSTRAAKDSVTIPNRTFKK